RRNGSTSVKTILLNPGPVNVSARVRAALDGPDLCHREAEYFDLQDDIRSRLVDAFGVSADYTPVLLTGGGTAMVEAMIASGIPRDGRLLVLQNGVYGERIVRMARAHAIECDVVESGWTARPAAEAIETRLAQSRFDALAIVHHETTTGLLNDVGGVAAIC